MPRFHARTGRPFLLGKLPMLEPHHLAIILLGTLAFNTAQG